MSGRAPREAAALPGAPVATALAALAPIGLAAGWLVLSGATGLNYHLLPLATVLAPSVARGALRPPDAARRPAAALLAIWGAIVSAAVLLLLASLGRPLDPWPVLVVLMAVGAAAATWWAGRRGGEGA